MNQIILSAVRWCRQKDRTVLEDWIIPERFENLMGGMAEAVWGLTGGRNWSDQTAFLRSAAGAVYMQELEKVQRACRGELAGQVRHLLPSFLPLQMSF